MKAPMLCKNLEVSFECEIVGSFDPPAFDDECVKYVRNAAERLGYSYMDIISGAGHDACWINRVAPTAMVMCPCEDGLSHNEAENITKEWSTAGANVLFHAVVETAVIDT
ncbi:MAG: M20/M25/M40 family metallo-hydrolase, partial [Methyloligellaceae bacterium]